MKFLALICGLISIVYSTELEISVVDYLGMYNGECQKSSTDSNDNNLDTYYTGSSSSPSRSSTSSSENSNEVQQSSTFCKCLKKVTASGKSYSNSQNDFSKCMDDADGNNAQHWEKMAKKYAHKYGVNTDSWDLPQITTTSLNSLTTQDLFAQTETIQASDAVLDDIDVIPETNQQQDDVIPDQPSAASSSSSSSSSMGLYITFIGSSILLFICAWFIKDGLKKKDYQNVNKNNNNYDYDYDWDDVNDNYDLSYNNSNDSFNKSKNKKKNKKKGKFADWNQYSTV